MGKKIGKNTSKNLSSKCDQKILDHAKQSATDVITHQEQPVFFLVRKLLIKSHRIKKIHNKIFQQELKMSIYIYIYIYIGTRNQCVYVLHNNRKTKNTTFV